MVNVKLATSGGLREALATAQVARENEVDLVVGYMPTTPAIAAAPARPRRRMSERSESAQRPISMEAYGGRTVPSRAVRPTTYSSFACPRSRARGSSVSWTTPETRADRRSGFELPAEPGGPPAHSNVAEALLIYSLGV